jgi:hypothetical protein
MELGSRINITTNISGASTVCVDIDHPDYGDNYTCGTPNANLLFNISYFRNNEFNDSDTAKNLTWSWAGGPSADAMSKTDSSDCTSGTFSNLNDADQSTSYDCIGSGYVMVKFTSLNWSGIYPAPTTARWLLNFSNDDDLWKDQYPCGASEACFWNWSSSSFVSLWDAGSLYPSSWLINVSLPEDAFKDTGEVYIATARFYTGATGNASWYETWITYDGIEAPINQTHYIKQHQYDEIVNVSLNVTGYVASNTFPTDVKIYINDTLSNDLGLVYSGNISLDELNDSSTSKNFTYDGETTHKFYFNIPKNAVTLSAFLNFSGFNISYPYCLQETANVSTTCGGLDTGTYDGGPNGNWRDGDYSTLSSAYCSGACQVDFMTNYTIPPTSTGQGSILRAKWYLNGVIDEDLTIPSSCMTSPLQINNSGSFQQFKIYCKNSSGVWENLYESPIRNPYYPSLYEEAVTWNLSDSYVSNASLEIGVPDGDYEWNYTGKFNVTNNKTANFSGEIDTVLSTCTADSDGYCQVPACLSIAPATYGIIQVSDINITYTSDLNPVYLDTTLISSFLGNSTNFVDIPLKFENLGSGGIIGISDIRLDYAGGNDTIIVTTTPTAPNCYQESANVSNQSGTDGNCDLNYSGDYLVTYNAVGTNNYVYVNYTKPEEAIEANWSVKHGDLSTYNVTIPNSCFNYDDTYLILRMHSYYWQTSEVATSYGECLNSSGWNIITQTETETATQSVSEANQPEKIFDGDWSTYQLSYHIFGQNYYWGTDVSGPDENRWYEEGIWWTTQENLSLINYYSDWDYSFPNYVDYLEFIPNSPTSKNVTPYGQTSNTPIFNVTTHNYGNKNMNLSIYLNETNDCINLTIGTTSTKSAGTQLTNGTWTDLLTNRVYLNNSGLWMWADYGCTGADWSWWFPDLYFRGCCYGCDVCSEDLA